MMVITVMENIVENENKEVLINITKCVVIVIMAITVMKISGKIRNIVKTMKYY